MYEIPFQYSRIWNFSTVLTKNKFPGGKFLNLSTVFPISLFKNSLLLECVSD